MANSFILRISLFFVKVAYWLLPILKYTLRFIFWGFILVLITLLLFVIF